MKLKSRFTLLAILLFLLLVCWIIWRSCCPPDPCKQCCDPLPDENSCVSYMTFQDTAIVMKEYPGADTIQIDTLYRQDSIPYRCGEVILDPSHPLAGATRDSLLDWGFCRVKSCPCLDSTAALELWRHVGDQQVEFINNTPTGSTTIVVDGQQKPSGIGGWMLNFLIEFPKPRPNSHDSIPSKDEIGSNNNKAACTSKVVRIAVVDTGVDISPDNSPVQPNYLLHHDWHPPGSLTSCKGINTVFGINILGNNANGNWEPTDENGHGTHINGIITGVAPNGGDRGGVPFEFINVKIAGQNDTCELFDAMCGLFYALAQGADVINISWGFAYPEAPTAAFNPFFAKAQAQGVVLVAGLGNDGKNVDGRVKFWPACFASTLSNMIAVGGLNEARTGIWHESNWSYSGTFMTIAAPAENVPSTFPRGINGNNSGLAYMSGTSMATPYVVRTVATMIGLSPGPIAPLAIKTAIKSSADNVPVPWGPPTQIRLRHDAVAVCPAPE